MSTYDLGDGVNLDHYVYNRDNVLTAATVAITVTRPNGTTFTAPTITNPSTGFYRAATFVPDAVGSWAYAWSMSGNVADVVPGSFYVANPGAQPYVTLPKMKAWLKIDPSDTADDDLIADALASVTTEIDDACERTFTRDLVASTRTFEPVGRALVLFDDFYTLTDLAITVDGTAWTAPGYCRLKPDNGLVRGRPWPYSRLEALNGYCLPLGWNSVSITARWGWATVPDPVFEACKIAAADTLGSKDARFGVAGYRDFGPMRVRDNPIVMAKLRPYMRRPVKAA